MSLDCCKVHFGCFFDASCVADIIPYFDGSFDNFFKNIAILKEDAKQDIKCACELILNNTEEVIDWIKTIMLYRFNALTRRNKFREYTDTLITLNKVNSIFNALLDLRSFYGKCKCKDISHITLSCYGNDFTCGEIETFFYTSKYNKMPTLIEEIRIPNDTDECLRFGEIPYAVAMSKEDFFEILQAMKGQLNIYQLNVEVDGNENMIM